MNNEPEFTKDGYPTKRTIQAIRDWEITDNRSVIDLLEFCQEAWYWPELAIHEDGVYCFNTGGWSGNEEIIEAMEGNRVFWYLAWLESARGGHYKFKPRGTC